MTRPRRFPRKGDPRMMRQFCHSTSIHGLRHIFEDGNLFVERLVWMLVFLSGICFSGYFCWQVWQKWEQSPVLTSVETHLAPLKNVPFPAVTICNVNKVSERKLYDAILGNPKFNNVSYSQLQTTLGYMTRLDRVVMDEEELLELSQFFRSLNISAHDLFKILTKTAPACSDMIMDCNWLGLSEPCMKYFSFLPTDDGMCCTFNGGEYFDTILGIGTKTYEPLRVNGNGYRMGLTLVIDANLDDCSVTNGKFDGFKVLVHSPEEFPDVADRGFVLGLGTETFVGVKATSSFYTAEVLREVTPAKRQCLAEGEKVLKYFRNYSRSACFVECDANLMIERCQCRPFFFRGENKTELCELKSFTCISKVYEEIRGRSDEVCDCLPPCTDTWYEPEISYASFPGRGFNRTRTYKRIMGKHSLDPGHETNNYLKSNVAMLHVYFKEKTGMRYRTDIRFGKEDFISAIGGLLGLGLGMSFISAIEILYFLFFRRIFLWYRSYWSSGMTARENGYLEKKSPLPFNHKVEFKKTWPSTSTFDTSIPSIATISTISKTDLCSDHIHHSLDRRGSLNLPRQLQARLNKY